MTDALKEIRSCRLAQAGKSVETVKRWIIEHYNEPAELGHLANLVYLTPSYLSKLFKTETGMTITDYLIEIRIKKAKHLLKQSAEMKIHEIGSEVGYPDPAYFNKLFKRMVGITPNEYKRISQ
ncbi:HTH-type transcriptional regulator YesS [compost metagenome]